MATKLFLRSTADNAIGNFYDMVTTAGASATTGVVNTTAAGTQIQWTRTAGGTVLEWISGRVPAGGFTLSGTMSFSIWASESNMSANIGARARVFKRTSAGSESEVGGGPYDDGVEFGTANGEMTWTGTPSSTSFAEDDRIVVRFYITNIGTMATGYTGTITYDAADAATGDSFFQINENVTFKAEPSNQTLTADLFSNSNTLNYAHTVTPGAVTLTASLFTDTNTFYTHEVANAAAAQTLTASLFTNSNTLNYQAQANLTLIQQAWNNAWFPDEEWFPRIGSSNTFYTHSLTAGTVTLTASLYENTNTFYTQLVEGTGDNSQTLTASLYSNDPTFYTHTLTAGTVTLTPDRYDNSPTFYTHTLAVGTVTLTPDLYSNSPSYFTHVLTTGEVTLTASLYTNDNSFFSHTLSSGEITLTASLYTNSPTFYEHTLTTGEVTLEAGLYSDSNTFYTHSISSESSSLVQSAIFENVPTFYDILLEPYNTLSSPFYENTNEIFLGEVYNQYPDPSTVLMGVKYGDQTTIFVGTMEEGLDKSPKLDLISGKLIKPLTNKVAISL